MVGSQGSDGARMHRVTSWMRTRSLQDLRGGEEPEWKTVFEPFRIKVVEPIPKSNRAERRAFLQDANYNLFGLRSDQVILDFLTDSGTGAMSSQQWGGVMVGDESYAGAGSWYKFLAAVQNLFSFAFVLPTHQGRAAENILYSTICREGDVVPNNTHFDTTRANVQSVGATAVDLGSSAKAGSSSPFLGNMDLQALRALLDAADSKQGGRVPCVIMTCTNNAAGGQPVSMSNIRECSELCKQRRVLFILDGCRFAENAWFIKTKEPGYADQSITQIVKQMSSYFDGMTMSAKKDGFGNIGGWLALSNADLAQKCQERLILTEGFTTYGGLAGRDLEAIAQGLKEIVEEDYLSYRIRTVEYLAGALQDLGVPVVMPLGGHAIYVDAGEMLPQIPKSQFPGQALACALYVEGGIRTCEIGSFMFGKDNNDGDTHDMHGDTQGGRRELIRIAIPRRTYTQSHFDYLIEVMASLYERRAELGGYEITWQPKVLRHFTSKLKPLLRQ